MEDNSIWALLFRLIKEDGNEGFMLEAKVVEK